MSQLTLRHGPEFQRCVIKAMLSDRQFCSKAHQYLESGFFSGELSWFFRKTRDLFDEYKRPPNPSEMQSEVYKHVNEKERAKYEVEWELIKNAEAIGKDYLKKEITAFIQANIFVGAYQQAASLYNAGDRQSAYDFIKAKMHELYDADFQSDRISHFGDADKLMEEASLQSRDAIPTGIHLIDEAMHGGMMPQTWTTFIGGSNVGKSMLCPNLAKAAYVQKKKKTFVMIHEDEEIPTKLRYLACFSGVPYNCLLLPKSDRSEEETKLIKDADEILKEYVKLKFMYSKESLVEVAGDTARRMMDQWGYHLLIDDYLQCLKTKAFKSIEDTYTLYEYNTQEFKQLCCELEVPGAGGAQTNRLGHKISRSGSDLIRCTDIGDSWGIIKKSSNVITMTRSEADMQIGRMTYLLDKVRNGRCPVAVQCLTDYSRCMTFLPWSDITNTQQEIPIAA